ncbi:VCBS repeat-containing protein [Cystobacter fuscus]|uniref:FG-GAP and VCBS repeat-containing protein n=1 Tax=Cystobacter fuscus TaxID=43 RepID=UPI002B280C15|nr:VCBS repeat-containing protein [Cystobacter fuscus]
MNRAFRASLALALLLSACSGPGEDPLDSCAGLSPLALTADSTQVRVNMGANLKATGGSGYYSYRLEPGGSSGQVNGSRFVAGPTPGTDTVVVEDLRCPGDARLRMSVVAAFGVAPTRATLKPGTSFQVEVTGVLGSAVFSLDAGPTGSTVSPTGVYTAGQGEGVDLVRVRDDRTGDVAQLQFEVRKDARLRGSPVFLGLPAGSSIPLRAEGGTDRMLWAKLSGPGRVEGARFVSAPEETGTAEVQATDAFTGEKATLSVRVLTELTRETQAHGLLTDVASVVTADFDGDGVEDVAVGRRESDLGKPSGGAVFIFKGSPSGLPAQPTWVLVGETNSALFGDTVLAGDLDKDGRAELVVSSPGADTTIADSGAVYLYRFGEKGPERIGNPVTNTGRGFFGSGLALADMDGDGDLDLVVGSPLADLVPGSGSSRGVVDIYLLTPGQTVPQLSATRLGGMDLGKDGTLESRKSTELGRALVVADLNGDGLGDLAALSKASRFNADGSIEEVAQQTVAVFFARGDGERIRSAPDLIVLPSNYPTDKGEGTWRLAAVPGEGSRPPLLMVLADKTDAPDLRTSGGSGMMTDAGGALLFDLSKYKPEGAPAAAPVQLKLEAAFARLYGDATGGTAGRSWAVMDVDGNPGSELLLGEPYASPSTSARLAGRIIVHPLATLTRGTVLNKPLLALQGQTKSDTLGAGLAVWSLPGTSALVAFSGRASGPGLAFTGRVDAYLKAGSSLSEWTRTSALVPARPSKERYGEGVAVASGAQGGAVALVGAQGWAGPGPNGDGNDLNAGRAWVRDATRATLAVEGASAPLWRGRSVGSDVAFTDFNGDGRADAVVGASNFTQPGASVRAAEITPYFVEKAACLPASSVEGLGGVQVLLGQADGSFKQAYWLWAPEDFADCTETGSACKRRALGRSVVGGFDFNGDGKQDLGVLRNNGFELFLGRAPDDASLTKLSMGCDPVYSSRYFDRQTSAPAALGDLDGDKCDEVAWRAADGSASNVIILFGYDASGAKCARKVPTMVRLADRQADAPGLYAGLGGSTARVGRVLGKSGADYLAVTATNIPYEGVTQPSVLLIDVAEVVKRRPTTGEVNVKAVDLNPIMVVSPTRAVNFGAAVRGNVDLTKDGVPELIVSASGASVSSDGGGAVFVYEGGPAVKGAPSPWILLTGDTAERSNFGQSLALTPGDGKTPPTLVIGAPLSYRTGAENGTAFMLPLTF